METSRSKGWQATLFAALATLILLQEKRFGSQHPQTLGVGVVLVLLSVWEALSGRASLLYRSVKKSDNPTLFWCAVFFSALVGVGCMAVSFF